jgi:hypothetical protein
MTAALRTAGTFAFAVHAHADHQQQQVIERVPPGRTAAAAAAGAGAELQGPWPWEVYGIAFSTSGRAAWYIPLYKCGSRRRLRLLWEGARALLQDGGLTKVGFALKHQLKLLAEPPPLGALVKDRDAATADAAAGSSGGGASGSGGVGGASTSGPTPAGAGDADSGSVGLQPILVADPMVDVRVGAWMLQPNDYGWERRQGAGAGLKSQSARLRDLVKGKQGMEDGEQVVRDVTASLKHGLAPQEGQNTSRVKRFPACERACLSHLLYRDQLPLLRSEGLQSAMRDLDMPLIRVLSDMEDAGIALDLGVLARHKTPLLRQMARLIVSLSDTKLLLLPLLLISLPFRPCTQDTTQTNHQSSTQPTPTTTNPTQTTTRTTPSATPAASSPSRRRGTCRTSSSRG